MVGGGRTFSYTVDGMCMDDDRYYQFKRLSYFSTFLLSCRFEIQGAYSDYISNGDGSRQTISTSVSTFRKYLLTSRVFDHQDWSAGFNCWVSRPGCAGRLVLKLLHGGVRSGAVTPLAHVAGDHVVGWGGGRCMGRGGIGGRIGGM